MQARSSRPVSTVLRKSVRVLLEVYSLRVTPNSLNIEIYIVSKMFLEENTSESLFVAVI